VYVPKIYKNEDQAELFAFIRKHAFGTLVTSTGDLPFATHLPLVLDETRGEQGMLIGHLARANPQWQHFQTNKEVLVIFQGPHTYISPTWYVGNVNVPTWNYTAVHVYGRIEVVDDQARVVQMLDQLVAVYEGDQQESWSVDWDDARYGKMVGGIVAFEISIGRIEGKFKLNQNKSIEDRRSVVQNLQKADSLEQQAIATMMQSQLKTEEIEDHG
jgi:transcriptional regulator